MSNIRTTSQDLIKNYSDEYIEIENGIYETYNDINMYIIHVVKVIENLKNPYVRECMTNGLWNPKDIHSFEKDTLNPEKWQQIQEDRMPKSITGTRKKGMFRCRKCSSYETTHNCVQIRSADEPATVFVSCEDCLSRFKF